MVVHVCERDEGEVGPSVGRIVEGRHEMVGRARLGLVVPRAVGTAVERNRLKRQIRVAWRELRPRTAAIDCVVVVRKRAVGSAFGELAGNLENCLRSLNVLTAPASASAIAATGTV